MRVGVMVTNGGSHPPEKWAAETAAQIVDVIQIDESSIVFDTMTVAKAKLQDDLTTSLTDHHEFIQSNEVDALTKYDTDRLEHPIDPDDVHLDEAVNEVLAVTDKTIFAAHFRKTEVIQFVRNTLGSHFSSVKQIERSWHADKNPDDPKAKAFIARYHG